MELYKHALTTVLEDLIIIGAGGLGREVAAMVKSSFSDVYRVMQQIKQRINKPDVSYPNLIHPGARLHAEDETKIGEGNIITDGCILTTSIVIGDFNLINLSCTVGHDTQIGDYNSIMPGVNISGFTKLKDQVYVGTGAMLINGAVLGDKCVVGAGAVVTTNIPSGKTYVGIPAKEINHGR